ncbi:hypothetical protein [Brasilonema bromeliae]|uniref:hypothetical protein n=1 Tax=Brasilonema bromeliae TaxID=383615 RepID=UPI00145CC6FC|nr:hypothetical protein [Brasilonema bromeliae]
MTKKNNKGIRTALWAIAAINAIAQSKRRPWRIADFACILTVTHMPHLKEAFQARIEVNKTQSGSQVRLLI